MISDEAIERIVQLMIPHLRLSFRTMFDNNIMVHAFNCAEVSSNVAPELRVGYVCIIAEEASAAILESTANGIDKANAIFQNRMKRVASLMTKEKSD
jgi:hypothetical protein